MVFQMRHRTYLLWAALACLVTALSLSLSGAATAAASGTGGVSSDPGPSMVPPVSTLPQQADLLGTLAIAPEDAPEAVKQMIAAGNRIRHKPYLWGGGHRSFNSRGYDCSGSVSYLLHAAGLLTTPMDSSQLMRWGDPGPGHWVSVYSNPGHAFIVVAGLRFDTGYVDHGAGSGPRWSEEPRPDKGYVVRHPEL